MKGGGIWRDREGALKGYLGVGQVALRKVHAPKLPLYFLICGCDLGRTQQQGEAFGRLISRHENGREVEQRLFTGVRCLLLPIDSLAVGGDRVVFTTERFITEAQIILGPDVARGEG